MVALGTSYIFYIYLYLYTLKRIKITRLKERLRMNVFKFNVKFKVVAGPINIPIPQTFEI